MTAKEALKKLNKTEDLIECCDFGEFYGFVFGKKGETIGTAYTCVNKKTGDIFGFAPYDDFDIYENGIVIPENEI